MKHTSEQMQLVINEWQASRLSKKEFCRERNIKYPTFQYWCKRLNSTPATGFTEVRIQRQAPSGGCEIMFPSGARMIIHGEPCTVWLRELLR